MTAGMKLSQEHAVSEQQNSPNSKTYLPSTGITNSTWVLVPELGSRLFSERNKCESWGEPLTNYRLRSASVCLEKQFGLSAKRVFFRLDRFDFCEEPGSRPSCTSKVYRKTYPVVRT